MSTKTTTRHYCDRCEREFYPEKHAFIKDLKYTIVHPDKDDESHLFEHLCRKCAQDVIDRLLIIKAEEYSRAHGVPPPVFLI